MLPMVEAVEDADRHAAMLLAANPAKADLQHHVELLQTGEHRNVFNFPILFWSGGVR